MRRCAIASIVCGVLCLVANYSEASPRLNYGQVLNSGTCTPSSTGKMVLNIVFQVTNDADSGFAGYWAIDSYMKHVQVWDQGDGTFCGIVKYNGSFVTVAGNSPGGNNTVSAGVTGTMEGGYSVTITGSFTPGAKRTKGNIGAKDYECSISGGTPTCGTMFNWVQEYFNGSSTLTYWGWIYKAGDNGTWVNAGGGSSGDITGS